MRIEFHEEAGDVFMRIMQDFAHREFIIRLKTHGHRAKDVQLVEANAETMRCQDWSDNLGRPDGPFRDVPYEDIESVYLY